MSLDRGQGKVMGRSLTGQGCHFRLVNSLPVSGLWWLGSAINSTYLERGNLDFRIGSIRLACWYVCRAIS